MTITCSIASGALDRVRADVLVVPVFAGGELGSGADVVDDALGGTLATFMSRAAFDGKVGESLFLPVDLTAKAALLIGLGPRAGVTADGIRVAAAAMAQRTKGSRRVATTLADAVPDSVDRSEALQALAEGAVLGAYEFLEYRTKPSKAKLAEVVVVGRASGARRALDRGLAIAGAVVSARDMVNTPAHELSPERFAKEASKLLRDTRVRVEVLDPAAMRRERLGGVLGVGQGSRRPPRLVKMTYSPRGARGSLALVGKGVVFDSGGLSLKTGSGMETMKTDMAGAAAVIATMSVLSTLDVKSKVVAYAPMVENMPSGEAIRPGDVLTFRNGKTAEVLNTDAEGRLILADALALAAEGKPDVIVDLATLTGACVVALGEKIAGLMSNDDDVRADLEAAAARAGESIWSLPLPKQYRKLLDSEVADMKNISGGGYGGALTAGLFLEEFVAERPWAHLDLAGPARVGADDGYARRGATGFGVRTLVEFVTNHR